MADLDGRNDFATKTEKGRYVILNYFDARVRWREGGELYERVVPKGCTPREKAQIPWTLVPARNAEEA